MNRLLLLCALFVSCSPPKGPPPPSCPLDPAAKRALPLVANFLFSASQAVMLESSRREDIIGTRSLVSLPGSTSVFGTILVQCTGEAPPTLTRCSSCTESGTCPLPDQCAFTKCTGPNDAAMSRVWFAAGDGFEYTPRDDAFADVRYRYRGDATQDVSRTFEADVASTTVTTSDDLVAIVDGETVDLGHVMHASMHARGQEVLDFELNATFEKLLPEHLLEVRATASQINIFVDGTRLGVAQRVANHAEILWFGACH